ncbi:MAG TPA: hypothetical protein VME17_11925 [Bryobacteraceae bacterium]|nr:hypothetical protein [Bryobacteraceae bacterium]
MVRSLSLSLVSVGLMAGSLLAQGPGRHMGGPGDFAMVRAEFGMTNKVVQGAPYSAQAVTQFTQTLANGDHISRTTTASIARDSQGRTRTERPFGAIGALSAGQTARSTVMIFDPVAAKSYVLDATSHTARSMPIRASRLAAGSSATPRTRPARNLANVKTEDLGTQVIQGLTAQGKRVTRTIPAGAEGNEKEIDIVTETWYSPDLQTIVMSKTSDPRYGDSVYQLTGVNRAEPDPTLFVVPSDYTVKEGRGMHRGPAPVAQ